MKMTSEQFREGFDGDVPHFGDLTQYPMRCVGLQPMVQGHRDCMGGRSVMPKPDDFDRGAGGRADRTIRSHVAREFHAASTGISSSFT